ncbi:MAG: acid phosphatase [Xanthomonadales bacterium]|nr:acid phosphatase [Xanthomonadales bacterium]
MADQHEHDGERIGDPGTPEDPARRRLLEGLALGGAALTLAGCQTSPAARAPMGAAASAARLDALLREHIHTVVVIYAENRSFNNLFGNFPGVEKPLHGLPKADYLQRDRDGSVLQTLPPVWGGLVSHKQIVQHREYHIGEDAITGLPNQPWALRTPTGEPLPTGLVTHDLWHRFYTNQMQINGGRNDGFVAWGNTGAQVMGHYGDGSVNLRLWSLAREFTLCDNFFMGAFGGSFLNHQYLIAAQPPFYPNAPDSPAKGRIAVLEGNDPAGQRLKLAADSPPSAMQGKPKFASHATLSPDYWVVNTMGPAYAPAFTHDPARPAYALADDAWTLPAQVHATIGDALSAKGVDWAWYGGGWQLALDGRGDDSLSDRFPDSPNFQPHHQPFNYFKAYAPGSAARQRHLRDGGVGETARSNLFMADIEKGSLPPVAFYKPQGNLNMHAGYSDVDSGDRHIARIIDALRASPQWQHMLVVVTVDENGGWWDHVAPPRADRWGPGTRIPALVISPHAKSGYVDHSVYDTGSIARFLTRRFDLQKLPGLRAREQAMQANAGIMPGDLTATLRFHEMS